MKRHTPSSTRWRLLSNWAQISVRVKSVCSWDIFHLFTSHTDVAAVRNLTNEQVVNVHVNDAIAGRSADEQIDNARTLPAETGLTDIAGFLQALDAIGYDGPVTVEPFSQRIRALAPADAAQAAANSLKRSWQLAGLSR